MSISSEQPSVVEITLNDILGTKTGEIEQYIEVANQTFTEKGGKWGMGEKLNQLIFKAATNYYLTGNRLVQQNNGGNPLIEGIFERLLGSFTFRDLKSSLLKGGEYGYIRAYCSAITRSSGDVSFASEVITDTCVAIHQIHAAKNQPS